MCDCGGASLRGGANGGRDRGQGVGSRLQLADDLALKLGKLMDKPSAHNTTVQLAPDQIR